MTATVLRLPTFSVRCPSFLKTGIRSRAQAERLVAQIEALGACQHDHEIAEESP